MPEIAVVGSLNLDTTVRVPRLPGPGETILGEGHFDDTGGKGANQAVAAARLGRDVAMVGMVGADPAGDRLRAVLDAEGVDVAAVSTHPDVPTGMAVITVDSEGENTIVVDPAANGAFASGVVAEVATVVASADVVLLQLEIPLPTVSAAVAQNSSAPSRCPLSSRLMEMVSASPAVLPWTPVRSRLGKSPCKVAGSKSSAKWSVASWAWPCSRMKPGMLMV